MWYRQYRFLLASSLKTDRLLAATGILNIMSLGPNLIYEVAMVLNPLLVADHLQLAGLHESELVQTKAGRF